MEYDIQLNYAMHVTRNTLCTLFVHEDNFTLILVLHIMPTL